MNQAHRFEQADRAWPRPAQSLGIRHFAARARQQRADAAAAMIASAFRGMTGALRLCSRTQPAGNNSAPPETP